MDEVDVEMKDERTLELLPEDADDLGKANQE